MKVPANSDYMKIELEELKSKLLIFQSKANNAFYDMEVRKMYALKARKTQLKISQLKAQMGDSEQGGADLATPHRKSDGHV
jgi:hypothetical protein